ncbi:hypothetical protein OEG92_01365 [Polaribacter sejongensis]
MNNSVRHGKAKNSTINISHKDKNLIFSYTDNGIGFNSDKKENKKGLGMKNIESRVSLLNGKYSIGSEVGKGFNILIVI